MLIGFFCVGMFTWAWEKIPIRPLYVNVASGSFFWRGFLFRAVGAALLFFYSSAPVCLDKKINVLHCVGLQKP